MFPILETERLVLREIIKDDKPAIFDYFSRNDVIRYYGMEALTNIEQAEQLVNAFAKNYQDKRGIRWGIELKHHAGLIGTIGFNAWSSMHKRAEIGYDLHPDFWGKGYASEAVTEVVSYGFNVLDLTRIGAVVFIENKASNTLLTKLGFEKEGILKNYMYQNGDPYDTNMYSLLKSRF
ncbi:GNAT family N-acetyltransferase [Viridibacillus sp. YIM B01967]|uniref:GNAT family N-acetyltransferase n=1 Tax=Viridibacillus soli TaxID=2798301 RepID=A0ABS1H413_9BACL|nr:GNAT family protein [Viridibacillus soli]MBK3494141.1 GNAT family N-acetyltransferase [Viridibacillus soli]